MEHGQIKTLQHLSTMSAFIDYIRRDDVRPLLARYLLLYDGAIDGNNEENLNRVLGLLAVSAPTHGVSNILTNYVNDFARGLLTERRGLFYTLSYIVRAVIAVNQEVNQEAMALDIVNRYLDNIQTSNGQIDAYATYLNILSTENLSHIEGVALAFLTTGPNNIDHTIGTLINDEVPFLLESIPPLSRTAVLDLINRSILGARVDSANHLRLFDGVANVLRVGEYGIGLTYGEFIFSMIRSAVEREDNDFLNILNIADLDDQDFASMSDFFNSCIREGNEVVINFLLSHSSVEAVNSILADILTRAFLNTSSDLTLLNWLSVHIPRGMLLDYLRRDDFRLVQVTAQMGSEQSLRFAMVLFTDQERTDAVDLILTSMLDIDDASISDIDDEDDSHFRALQNVITSNNGSFRKLELLLNISPGSVRELLRRSDYRFFHIIAIYGKTNLLNLFWEHASEGEQLLALRSDNHRILVNIMSSFNELAPDPDELTNVLEWIWGHTPIGERLNILSADNYGAFYHILVDGGDLNNTLALRWFLDHDDNGNMLSNVISQIEHNGVFPGYALRRLVALGDLRGLDMLWGGIGSLDIRMEILRRNNYIVFRIADSQEPNREVLGWLLNKLVNDEERSRVQGVLAREPGVLPLPGPPVEQAETSSSDSEEENGCQRRTRRSSPGMPCLDSRDEEDITKEEKEQRIKELFDTGKIRQVANNVKFQDRLFKVCRQISKGEDVIQDIEALVAEVKDIDLSSIDPEIRDIVREMKNSIENKEEIKNILGRSGVAGKIGEVAEGAGLAFTGFLVGKHIANGDVEGLSYDALNLWVMPKIGEKVSAEMLSMGEKLDSKVLKGSAPVIGRFVGNFAAFLALEESIRARQNARDPVDVEIADLGIETNSIFIAADVPAIATGTMSALGMEVGVIGEFTGPVGAAISVGVIIVSEFVMPGLEVKKLEEHIRLTDQEESELYWRLFFGMKVPDNIESDIEAKRIYEEYISKIVNRYGDYDRIMISLPSILVTESRLYVCTKTTPCAKEDSRSIKEKHDLFVDIEPHASYSNSDISRIIPYTVADYNVICGPLDKDIKEKIIEKEREREGSVLSIREVKEWSLQEYQKNVTNCNGTALYQKKGSSSPSKTLLDLSAFAARISVDPKYNLYVHFAGKLIMSYLKDSPVHGVHEKYGATHRYYFADKLLYCSIYNQMTNFFYITGKDDFFCNLRGSSNGQRNIVVTQGNFTDFENIHSVIGNNKTNYIKVSHASYVDGKGGSDVITASNSATIRGYFGDSIYGNGLVLLPINFGDIDKITYANNVTNIYNEGGGFISIDGQRSFKTANGLFVTPTKVYKKTIRVTNLHVIKRVDSNITLDDKLNHLQEIDNLNFDITKQLLSPNSTSIISNTGNKIFYLDKEHHNFYWKASSNMRHLYIIDQRNANVTIAQANGVLNFSQLNSTLDDMPFITNDEGEIKIEKDGLNITLLPGYKNVTVTFDGKEYYKLQDGRLERDYCSHSLKIDGRLSVNGTYLLNHYNCLTVDSEEVLFFKLEDNLLLLSGENQLLISAYYSSIHNDWNLSIKLNNGIIEPEKFRERADNPSTGRYYRPDEQGLQIYHNQPINKYQIGFMDLRNNSISEWSMGIFDEHLVLSLKNSTIIQIKNWNISQPARKMMFAFNDTVVFNAKCIVSSCNPEDTVKEFEEAQRRKDLHPIRHRRHKQHHREHLQEGRLIGATSGTSKPSSWINYLFGWVKDSVGGLFGSKVTLPGKPGNSTVQSLPNISQHNETAKGSSPSSFLSVENVALIGCIADALDNTQSKCYQTSKSQGVNFVPSIQTAVNFARREFDSFVEDKIRNLDSKEKARIRTEVKNAYPEIIESFRRGVEFSGNIGLDDVLEKCKKCFCTNILPNNVSQSESQMLGKTDDKPETRLSDVTVNNQQITGHTK